MSARNNSVLGLVYSVKSGIGIGPLPTALGDAEPDLVCKCWDRFPRLHEAGGY